ncbi:jg10912 [Pararge aegeria aegeria]|uniref:Jg10912 protein n=1 Tax=Pararge aegeria aegeria TaxID=348720 RepID=A0A8S4SEL6_9NEOP|nr:jg10912 [Pararge aegeria aegeria]
MGTPQHLVHLLRRLYEDGTALVRTDDVLSKDFHPSADWTDGVSIGGYKISNLRYADDTTLFATSARHMDELLLKMERVSLEFGLKINHNKTKMMIADRANNNSPEVTQIANCEVVQSYIYLGALISNNGGCVEEVKRRMAIARTAMESMEKQEHNKSY